jgi:phenylpyruvate tautomerase PptA (4-oxalocrotonate tautomerase family)
MPYVEVIAPANVTVESKQAFVTAVTRAITDAFRVPATAVTMFFWPLAASDYAFRGELGCRDPEPRVFIKIHVYRRNAAPRRAVANPISEAACACFRTPLENVAIYFMEREFDEVVHEGRLVSDGPLPIL